MDADPVTRREFHPDAGRLSDLSDQRGVAPGEPLGATPRYLIGSVSPDHLPDPDRWWDDLLTRSLRAPAFRMVRNGATLPRSQLCRSAGVGHQRLDDLIEPNRVLEAYDGGASLVLQGLQHTDPAMGRLSTNLALELDQPVQLNAYLSPEAARGLDLHFDYHDVIVVQLSGTKSWRVWAPLERSTLPQKRGPGIAKPHWDEVGEPLIDVTMQPGDALVIPRGHPHAAATIDDASAHLTVGVMSLTWQALIAQRLRDAAGPPSLSATASPVGTGSSGTGWSDAMTALAHDLDEPTLLRAHRLEVWRRQPRTRLRPRASTWDPLRPLRVTPGPLLWLDEDRTSADGPAVALQLGDRAVTMPAEAAPLLASVLRRSGAFTLDELTAEPGHDLDGESARAIVSALHREGVVAHGPI